jgi:DNA-binding CsgD family transcriptional regulator/PAS domain-containing protein
MLRLSTSELAALDRATRVLLTPFSYESGEAWRQAACAAVEGLLGASASSFALPVPGEQLLAGSPDVVRALQAVVPPPDWVRHGLIVQRRELGASVADWTELFDADAVRLTPFYNDVVRPHKLLAPIVLMTELRAGQLPAALSVYYDSERSTQPHIARRKQLAQLLVPAFSSGVKAYLGFAGNRAAFGSLLEAAPIGVVVFDATGRVLHQNAFFSRLVSCEPEGQRIQAEVTRVGAAVGGLLKAGQVTMAAQRAVSQVRITLARYRISAFLFDPVWVGTSAMIVAMVAPLHARQPDATEVAAHFHLTARETEAAKLLRRGLSSREIALALGISVNTARRHIERIIGKLGVHSRTAAAFKLAGD